MEEQQIFWRAREVATHPSRLKKRTVLRWAVGRLTIPRRRLAMLAKSTPPCLFLSHSGADTNVARELKRRLLESPEARAVGLRVWLDKDDLVAGTGWQTQLEKVINEEATAFAVHIGAQGVVNWVESEVRLALSRATGAAHFPFIPILSKCPSASSSLPAFARQYQAVLDPLNDPDEFTKLLAAVLGRSSGQLAVVLDSPFVGLKAMTEQEADRFFGRDEEIKQLINKLKEHPLVAIVADSGAGKSSLAQAGLIPKYRGGALRDRSGREPDDRLWHVVCMRPSDEPIRGLREAVTEAAERLGRSGDECAGLRRRINLADPGETAYAIRCDLPVHRTETLLIVDQFEELLTQAPQALRGPFVDLLMALATIGDFRIVLTLRADHFNLCRPLGKLFEHLMRNGQAAVLRLQRITNEGIAEAVCKPLHLAGHTDQAEQNALVTAIKRDITDHPGDLALVQMALYTTWQRHRAEQVDLLVAYEQVGGVAGALAHEAEGVRNHRLDAGEHALLFGILVRLVRLGETGGATRRMAQLSDFDEPRRKLAAKLATEDCGRLLLAGETSVEIAHEALITQWPWLQDSLNIAAGDMRILDRLMDRTQRWITAGRPGEHLATGADQAEFAALAVSRPDWLSKAEGEYTAASTRAVRMRRARSAALASAVVMLGLATGYTLYSNLNLAREQREIAVRSEQATRRAAETVEKERDGALLAQSRLLAEFASQDLQKGDAASAMLLALEGLPDEDVGKKRPLAHEAEAALFRAFYQLREKKVLAHEKAVWVVNANPDGLLVTGSEDGRAYVWSTREAPPLALDDHDGPVKVAIFSPTGHHLFTAGKNAQLWRLKPNQAQRLWKHTGPISCAAFSPDGKLVVAASENSARIWSVEDGSQVARLDGHERRIRSIAFSPEGHWILTGSDDTTARLWDAQTGNLVRVFRGHQDSVRSVAFSPRGRRAVTTSQDNTARLWHLEKGEDAIVLPHPKLVWSAAFSPDGSQLVTASDDGRARVWNGETGMLIRDFKQEAPVRSAMFSPSGNSILTMSDKVAVVWDVATGTSRAVLDGDQQWLESVTFRGEAQVVTASRDGTARVWDLRPQISPIIIDTGAPVRSAIFIRGGREVLTAGNGAVVSLWDAENGRRLGSSHDGRLILSRFSDKVDEIRDVEGTSLAFMAIPEDARDWPRILAKLDEDLAPLWKSASSGPTMANVPRYALSPDGSRIAKSGFQDEVSIRSVETGKELALLRGHKGSVHSITFSPDGQRVLTASDDGTARIWSSDTGELVAELGFRASADSAKSESLHFIASTGHQGPVWSAAFSPNGKRVVTASEDGTARIWRVFSTTQSLIREAKIAVPRCLTRAQRKKRLLESAEPKWCFDMMKWTGPEQQ